MSLELLAVAVVGLLLVPGALLLSKLASAGDEEPPELPGAGR
jgi:hypothetical protein